jgi:hypothetical protein
MLAIPEEVGSKANSVSVWHTEGQELAVCITCEAVFSLCKAKPE